MWDKTLLHSTVFCLTDLVLIWVGPKTNLFIINPCIYLHLFFFIKQVNGRASGLFAFYLTGLMVSGARGGAKLTEVISKQKHSFAWNGDHIINKGKRGEFSDHNENSRDTTISS